jgi:putative phosphoesterase
MKIAILSDIHANLEALEAIDDSWDLLWVLGDLVNYGPNPSEAVDFVRDHAKIIVSGNHDYAIANGVDPRCSAPFREMASAMQEYTQSVLSDNQKAFLRRLPQTARAVAGGRHFFLCHAAPSNPLYAYLSQDAPEWAAEAAAAEADIILAGHTHIPCDRAIGGLRMVNPGSVGQAKHGRSEACYAVWDDGVISFRSRAYDVEKTVRKLSALPIEQRIRTALADTLREGRGPAVA